MHACMHACICTQNFFPVSWFHSPCCREKNAFYNLFPCQQYLLRKTRKKETPWHCLESVQGHFTIVDCWCSETQLCPLKVDSEMRKLLPGRSFFQDDPPFWGPLPDNFSEASLLNFPGVASPRSTPQSTIINGISNDFSGGPTVRVAEVWHLLHTTLSFLCIKSYSLWTNVSMIPDP